MDWRHIGGSNLPEDLGTRKWVKVAEISEESDWIQGLPWMRGCEEEFPTSTIEDLRLSQQEMAEANNEKLLLRMFFCHTTAVFATISHEKTNFRYDDSD